jgi:hypothetical protein
VSQEDTRNVAFRLVAFVSVPTGETGRVRLTDRRLVDESAKPLAESPPLRGAHAVHKIELAGTLGSATDILFFKAELRDAGGTLRAQCVSDQP